MNEPLSQFALKLLTDNRETFAKKHLKINIDTFCNAFYWSGFISFAHFIAGCVLGKELCQNNNKRRDCSTLFNIFLQIIGVKVNLNLLYFSSQSVYYQYFHLAVNTSCLLKKKCSA